MKKKRTTCDVNDDQCSKTGRIKQGLCNVHYQRLRKSGDFVRIAARKGEGKQLILDQLEHGDRSVCWEWPFGKYECGYGSNGEFPHISNHVHRIAKALDCGEPPPEGALVCHHCDNPPCFNPDHLYYGDDFTNTVDKVKRGRAQVGEDRFNATLTNDEVLEICALYDRGCWTYKRLAERFGTNKVTVGFIITGRSWSQVTGRYHESKQHLKPSNSGVPGRR